MAESPRARRPARSRRVRVRPPGAAIRAPLRKLRYSAIGASYMAVYEFGERTRGANYLHYGQSHRPESPHFFDQATLLSERRFKPAWLHREDVEAHATRAYRPADFD